MLKKHKKERKPIVYFKCLSFSTSTAFCRMNGKNISTKYNHSM
jgi:hypothetical protein